MINNQSKEYKLAYEIAETLGDLESLELHISIAERLNESVLRKILTKVMSVPHNQIKRTRGALYIYLIKQHGGLGHRG
jgi:hypothetical protein